MTDTHTNRSDLGDDALSRADRLLKAIGTVAANVVDTPPKTLFSSLLAEVLDVTDSAYGYIGEVLDDEDGPFLRTWAITDISWNAETREMYQRFAVEGDGMEFRNLDTLFGWGLRNGGRVVIANEVSADERAAGRPDRHPPLDSYLGLPLHSGGILVGQLGLANRPGGFDNELIEHLEPLLQVMTNLLVAHRTSTSAAATETELSVLVGALRSGVLFTDEDRRIVFANQRLCDLLGIDATPEDLAGRMAGPGHTIELADGRVVMPDPAVFGDTFADIQCVQEGDKAHIVEITGTDRVLERACRPVEFPNRLRTGALYIYHDVTQKAVLDLERESLLEREREQRRLAEESNQSLLELDRLKNEFVASVSHELRTPLASIASYTELILDGALDPQQREHLTVVHRNAARLSGLVDDLLLIARIESGSLEIERAPVNLSGVVRSVAAAFTPTLDAQELGLALALSEEDHPAFVDERRIDQVVRNLLSNAAKFTPRHGRIELATRRTDGAWELTVEDSGIGIPSGEIDLLFDRFYRATNARAAELPGSGLGLSIVAAIIDRHGGDIVITSPGSGTKVTVTLPDGAR